MRDLVAIIGNFGRHAEYLPITATRGTDRSVLFFDHRQPPDERADAVAQAAGGQPYRLDVYVTTPPRGCACGEHMWTTVIRDGVMVAAQCAECGHVVPITPVSVPTVTRLPVASSPQHRHT